MRKLTCMAAKSDYEHSDMWLPYVTHAMDTAGVMAKLFQRWLPEHTRNALMIQCAFPSDDRLLDFCRMLGLLHDIGKLTPAFQSRITGHITGHTELLLRLGMEIEPLLDASSSPHQTAGQCILEEMGFPKEIAAIVGLHHGRKSDADRHEQFACHASNYFGRQSGQEQEWRSLWKEWLDFVMENTGFLNTSQLPKPDLRAQMLLTGLLITADWIASNTYYFPYIPFPDIPDEQTCAERIAHGWRKLGFPDALCVQENDHDPEYFRVRFGFLPNVMQQEIMDIVSQETDEGLYILEAPMGLGKTEAALAAAEILIEKFGAGGIYFGLPTQATANGVFGRIRDWAEGCDPDVHTIRLAHGMTDLNEEYQSLFHGNARDTVDDTVIVHEWFEGRKQALLSDFVIATIDQFLLASLKQKHVMLRHLGLSGKVVVLDECHAYDAYMNVYLDRTLAWMGAYGVPVIVLSATLPPQRRNELIKAYLNQNTVLDDSLQNAYPVLTWTKGNGVQQAALTYDRLEKRVQVKEITENSLVAVLSSLLENGGCAGVIVNTVAYAQELCVQIREQMQDYTVICFHSRFIATDRAKIEQHLMKCLGKNSTPEMRERVIVVGTQVLEQSLDLDFDVMVTELCPMDLLLQRSGRLHRHKRLRPVRCQEPCLYLLQPEEERKAIYNAWILQQTRLYLPDELLIPACIPELVGKTYAEPEVTSELYEQYQQMIQEKKRKADQYCIKSNLLKSRRVRLLPQLLDDDAGEGVEAEASVRDAEETIEVLVLRRDSDRQYSLLSGEAAFDVMQALDDHEAKCIVRERLRLPMTFSKSYHFQQTMQELDVMPMRWRESPWLKGEMLLLLDKNAETRLCDIQLHYSREYGLEQRKEG